MRYDTIMANIDEWLGELWHSGWEEGWKSCATGAAHDGEDDWCEGFLNAWNANAATKLTTKNAGDPWHFECARCGATAMQGVQLGANVVKFKHCPNCGAEVRNE